MPIAFDALTESGTWTNEATPFTFNHTPNGTPKAVVVVVYSLTSNNPLTGTITYGGVGMILIENAVDTTGEPVRCQVWFLGSSILTGQQTVSIPHDQGTSNIREACVFTLTADGDTEVVDSGVIQANQANPQIALNSGAVSALRIFGIASGHQLPSELSLIGGMSSGGSDTLGGSTSGRADRETSASAGSTTVGYTATDDDVAMVAVAVAEVGGGPVSVPPWSLRQTTRRPRPFAPGLAR